MNSKSCLIFGEGDLALQCATLLQKRNFNIKFFSENAKEKNWCKINKIFCYSELTDVIHDNNEFDYLFSIVNSTIIPQLLLKKIKKLAINYHDSLLPKFSGVNATPWAILSGARNHGITWHVITEIPDAGDVILQKAFRLNAEDTTVSVRSRCAKIALESFNKLIRDLETQTYQLKPQDLTKRTYFNLYQKPYANALISWKSPAEEIDRLSRGLTFGNTTNVLSLPKFICNNRAYIPLRTIITTQKSIVDPGTIVELNAERIVIATKSNNISITEIITIDGEKLSLVDFIKKNNLTTYKQLSTLEPNFLQQFQQLSEKYSHHEKQYVQAFFKNQFATPRLLLSPINDIAREFNFIYSTTIPLEIIQKLRELLPKPTSSEGLVLALVFLYFYQLNNYQLFPNFVFPTKHIVLNDYQPLFSQSAPLTIVLSSHNLLIEVLRTISEQYDFINNLMYLKDIRLRYPKLLDTDNDQFKINFFISDDPLDTADNSFSVVINPKTLVLNFISKVSEQKEWISHSLVTYFPSWLNNFKLESSTLRLAKLIDMLSLNDVILTKFFKDNNVNLPTLEEKPTNLIHQIIEDKADEVPNNIALKLGSEQLSYRELMTQVNQLVWLLKPYLPTKQSRIALAFPRGFDGIIAALASLKLGAAYVPLDLNWPEARIKYILKDSEINLILTHQKYMSLFASQSAQVLLLDELRSKWYSMKDSLYPVSVQPEDTAYIIYTSGSTGQPKGVLVTHRGIANLALTQAQLFEIDERSRILQFASLSFDAAVSEWSTSLSQGACLCLLAEKSGKLTEDLIEIFKEESITVVTLPPSVARALPIGAASSLKTLVLAGEASNQALIDKWIGHVKLINAYGPTETTVCATAHVYQTGDAASLIGKPLANVQAYLMNSANQLTPPGVIGEIVVGGIGVAQGYLNREALTAERFIADFITKGEKRYLYRTGDLGRYRVDGAIEYVGRIDNQIKLRGYRIELGEIEQTLLTHPDIEEAVVLLKEIKPGQKALLAYIQLKEDKKPGTLSLYKEKLSSYLQERIPGYMIPEKWLLMDEWPLTVSGKIDRQHLLMLEPETEVESTIEKDDEPSTEIEKLIAGLWSKLLRLERVGLHDDFFRIGGDSITAIQFSSEAKKIGIQVTSRDLFRTRVLKDLIKTLKTSSSKEEKNDKIIIDDIRNKEIKNHIQSKLTYKCEIDQIYPLSPMQRGILINHLQHKEYDMYFRQKAFKVSNLTNIEFFKKAWQAIMEKHIIFKTAFFWNGLDAPVQFSTNNSVLPFGIHDVSNTSTEHQETYLTDLLKKDRSESFDLTKAPLFRSFLIKINTNTYYFVLTFHHILLDGWSVMEMLTTIKNIYSDLCEGKKLEDKTSISFRDYLTWLSQEDQELNRNFWKDYLHALNYNNDLLASIKLTKDHSEGFNIFEGRVFSAIYSDILQASRMLGFTLNSLLQFAWAILLAKRTQKEDILFGITIFGRTIQLENAHKIIGLLANTVPFRVRLNNKLDIIESLRLMQDQLVGVQQHALLPLFEIQSISDAAGNPNLFDTIFIFENYPKLTDHEANNLLVIEQYKNSLDVTEFPLTVGIEPSNELIIRFGYNMKYFSKSDIESIFKDYNQIIKTLVLSLQRNYEQQAESLCVE